MGRSEDSLERQPRRWKRWVAIAFAAVVLVVLAALWQLPWLLGTSAGRSYVASKLSTEAMRFSIDSLNLTWSGDQAIGGLRIRDAQDREVADVSAAFKGSLWSWAQGSRDFGTVALSGRVTVYESPTKDETKGGGTKPAPTGKAEDLSDIIIPDGVKAALELKDVNVKYVPLPGSSQPSMAVRDVQGKFAIDGRSPVTLNLGGATEIGSTKGSFQIDASVSDFAAANGALQVERTRMTAEVKGENLPVPIIEQMIGESGRLSAMLGESVSLTISAAGGMNGGDATLTASAPRANAEIAAAVDAQRRLSVTTGKMRLTADQRSLEAALGVDALAGLSLTQKTTATLDIQTLTIQLPTGDKPLDLATARIDATLAVDAASLKTGREDVTAADIRNFGVRITSDDPTKEITLTSTAELTSYLAEPARQASAPISAQITLLRAFKGDGAWSSETLGLAGLVRTQSVPTSLIDSLAGAGGWVVDAVGPELSQVVLSAGSPPADAQVTWLTMSAASAQGSVKASVRLAEGRLESMKDQPIEAELTVSPALRDRLAAMVAESAPEVHLEEGGRATVRITSFNATLPTEANADTWKSAAAQGSVVLLNGRGTYTATAAESETPTAPKRYDVDNLAIDFRTETLSQKVTADIKAAIKQNGVPLNVNGRSEVANALDASTRTITFETTDMPVPLELINAWASDQAALVTETFGGPIRLTLNAMQFSAGISANAKLRGERSDLLLTYAVQNEQPLFELRGTQRATPALVEALLGPEPAAALAEPADLTFVMSMPAKAAAGAVFKDWPLKLDASTPRAVLTGISGVPGAITAVNVKLKADWAAGLNGLGKYALTGQISDGKNAIASITSDLRYTIGGDWMKSRGRIAATDINVTAIENTLALEPGLLSAWLGGKGGVEVGSVTDSHGELTDDLLVSAKFDQASARIAGRLQDDRLVVNTPGTLAAHVDRTRLAKFLNEWTGAAASPAPATQWAAVEDSDVSATVRSVSLPLAVLSGGEYDPRQLAIDADFSVPRIALKQGATDFSLADTLLKIGGKNLAEGITAQLKSTTSAASGATSGGIDLLGGVKSATSNPDDRRYNVSGTMKGVPVAMVDALAQLDGKLVAALGPSMDMNLNVADAYASGGSLAASIVTPTGTLNVPKAELRDNTLVIEAAHPLAASLEVTPEMSSTLLANVNPLLYDVQKKAGPIAFNAPKLVLPLDGDISKLGGEFTLDLGQLYVPTQGILGEFLGQLKPKTDKTQVDRVETLIPPITGRIKKGVLEYDKFVMQSQSFEISTSGKVDLVNRKLDLLASVPLIGWKSVFADMTKIAPPLLTDIPLNVPFYLVVRGPIDKPEIKPDPKGAQRVANEFFKNFGGNLIDNALDNLFKPKK